MYASVGVDMGGSLCKIVELYPDDSNNEHSSKKTLHDLNDQNFNYDDFYSSELGGRLTFKKIPSSDSLEELNNYPDDINVSYTGNCQLNNDIYLLFHDELECLVEGLRFYSRSNQGFFVIDDDLINTKTATIQNENEFIIVNIGTGTSIIHVNGESVTRVSGTSLGGGTFSGLLELIEPGLTVENALNLAKSGDASKVDIFVGDIYHNGYANLSPNLTAGAFGKFNKSSSREHAIKSILFMICSHISQITYLYASKLQINNVIFVGSFLKNNYDAYRHISKTILFWSENNMRAIFAKHSGFLGAVGALLKSIS